MFYFLCVNLILLVSRSFDKVYAKDLLHTVVRGSIEQRHLLSDKFSPVVTKATQNDAVIPNSHLLDIVMSISVNYFRRKEKTFLQEISNNILRNAVACDVKSLEQIKITECRVEIYCFYTVKANQHIKTRHQLSLVSGKDLTRLLSSAPMRGFLQEYNVTRFFRKAHVKEQTAFYQITEEVWFPVATVAASSFVVAVVLLVFVCCCKKSCCHNDNDKVSQLEGVKHGAYVCHSVKPIETMSPKMVQPEMKELYTVGGSPRKVQKWTGEPKKPGLLQSRRGSQASLVLDLSPMTKEPVVDFSHESPTEESLSKKTKRLTYYDLEKLKDNEEYLYKEFWDIPANTIHRKDKQSMSNASLKNRYPDIIPNSKTAVKLKEIDNDPQSTYINSNFIRGYNDVNNMYIATEGPLQSTVADFWRMVWEYKSSIIVMITKLKEKNEEKCAEYWPSPKSKSQQTFEDITITYDSEINRNGFKITKLYLSHGKFLDESRLVTHYWFTSWPDHKVPKSSSEILSLVNEVKIAREISNTQSFDNGPVVVHCSAGRGRTGCFISICNALEQIEEDDHVDILKIVSTMRIERGGMVQKDEQYMFLYRTIYEYWREIRARSPSFQPGMPGDIEAAQEIREDSDVLQHGHFIW